MDEKQINEHFYKEALKKVVDYNDNYTQPVKEDLKFIIDQARNDIELLDLILIYFSGK